MTETTSIRLGPFTVGERLGSGGMADVYLAEHDPFGTRVALKVITANRAANETFRREFRREVQSTARLNHPGIVRVFDYGVVEQTTDWFLVGSPYLVMEVADRGSLDDARPRSWGGLRRIIFQLLDALAYSHARDVIHRDLKPANILLASAGSGHVRAKLTDFGIAHAHSPESKPSPEMLTNPVGTFRYMPPEQLEGRWREFGPWTDLYALGCTLWQLATGKPPFLGQTTILVAMQHLRDDPPEFEPLFEVPDGFEAWLRRILEKQPGNRFRCAADAALALSELKYGDVRTDEFVADENDVLVDELGATTIVTSAATWVLPTTGGRDWVQSADLESRATTVLEGVSRADAGRDRKSRRDRRPEVPSHWRRDEVSYTENIAGVGLGLFGLREIPFVGRERERDIVWGALQHVHRTGQPHGIILRGASGTGKSRIAQWTSQRADETGAARVMRVHHSAKAGATRGLHDLLERELVAWNLDDEELLHKQVRWRLTEFALTPPAPDTVEADVRALSAMLLGTAASSMTERVESVSRLIEQTSRERPVIVWLDDAQWDFESLALAQRFLSREIDAPVLFIATVQEEALVELPQIAELVDELGNLPRCDELRIQPLAAEEQAELVRRLLGLERRVAELVATATVGNPLFAIQLVGHWVEQGSLEPSAAGFRLAEGVDAPEDLNALWATRLRHVTAPHGGEPQLVALEAAAVLGDRVSEREWVAACEAAKVSPADSLISALVDAGMVHRIAGGFAFVHALLGKALRRLAVENGQWQRLNFSAAIGLARAHTDPDVMISDRIATHLLEAKQWKEALDPLAYVARQKLAAGEVLEASQALDRRAVALAAAAGLSGNRDLALQRLLESIADRRSGRGERSSRRLAEALELAREQPWPELQAMLQHAVGETAATSGDLERALEAYDRGLAILKSAGITPQVRYSILESRAWLLKQVGKTAEARRDLEEALDAHREAGDRVRELNVFNRLAFTFLAEGDYPSSREVAERGIELASDLGHRGAEAGCWTTLGEIERFEGNIDRARLCYERAEELDELCGSKHVHLVRANAALLEVGGRRWELARRKVDETEQTMVSIGYDWMLPCLFIARACCSAGLANWAVFDREWDEALEAIVASNMVERDVAWLAMIAAEAAFEHGEVERARTCRDFAVAQWRALGDENEVAAAEAKFTAGT